MISNKMLGKIAVAFATVAIAIGAVAIGFTVSALRGQDNLNAAIVIDGQTLFKTDGDHNGTLATQLMKLAKNAVKIQSTAGSPSGQSYWASNANDISLANGGKLPVINLFQSVGLWNTDAGTANKSQNITHLPWQLVYVSYETATSKEPVFTFMAAGAYRFKSFNSQTSSGNNYNSSELRNTVTSDFNAVLTNNFTGTADILSYIKTPGELPGLWQSNQELVNFTGSSLNDRMWIPSVREVSDSADLWKLTKDERNHQINSVFDAAAWLRTGQSTSSARTLNAGVIGSNQVNLGYTVLPAIHLSIADLACPHDYEWKTKIPATCTAQGTEQEVCRDCGDENEIRITDALGHDYIDDPENLATCANPAQKRICKNCGVRGEDRDSGLEHVWIDGNDFEPATCLNPGWQSKVCKNCGEEGDGVIIDATGHDYGDPVETSSTCTVQGYTIEICKNENCEEPERQTYFDLLPHDMIDQGDEPPNCYTPGSWDFVCKDCGYPGDNGPRYPIKCGTCDYCQSICVHNFPINTWEIDSEPTCILNGAKTNICTKCLFPTYVLILAPGSHDIVTNTTASTCSSSGYTITTCRRVGCGYSQTSYIPPDPKLHVWESLDLKDLAERMKGLKDLKSVEEWKDLKNSEDWEILKNLAGWEGWYDLKNLKNFEEWKDWGFDRIRTLPTCTSPGMLEVRCMVCEAKDTSKVISAIGHNNFNNSNRASPTCLTPGYKIINCGRCGHYSISISSDPYGHEFPRIPETGLVFEWVWNVLHEPTCAQFGEKTRKCKYCDYVETVTIQKLEHIPNPIWRVVKLSCAERVVEYQDCILCGLELYSRLGDYPDPCGECEVCKSVHDPDCECKLCVPPTHQCGAHCSEHCTIPNCKICGRGDHDRGLDAKWIGLIVGGVVLVVGGAIFGWFYMRNRKRKMLS